MQARTGPAARRDRARAVWALLAALAGPWTSAAAQLVGVPVPAGGAPAGFTVEAQLAFPDGDPGERWGAAASFAGDRLGITLSAATGGIEADAYGALGEAALVRRATSPFQVLAFAGAGITSDAGQGLRIPVGASIAFRMPLPYVTVVPWLAPRVQYAERPDDPDDGLEPAFGGGLDVRFSAGLGIRAAYDIIFLEGRDERTFGLGLSWTFHLGS